MERRYGEINNVKLSTRVPGRCSYAFADIPSYRADAIFIRAEIPVRFARREFASDEHEYVFVFCHFKKRYEPRFLECMADLERALIMEGHSDYPAFCRKIVAPLLELY